MYAQSHSNKYREDTSNKRVSPRKPPKRGVNAECRRGQMGLGRNLFVSIINISEGGICLVLNEELVQNEVAEIVLSGVGRSKPLKLLAEVRRVDTNEEGNFVTGFRFRTRISYADMSLFT
jgi:hypothetical protein